MIRDGRKQYSGNDRPRPAKLHGKDNREQLRFIADFSEGYDTRRNKKSLQKRS
jgi:hypothetical protein